MKNEACVMNLLKKFRQKLIQALLDKYLSEAPQAHFIYQQLQKNKVEKIILDHFALIELPSQQTGIYFLGQLFSALGFEVRGKGYLANKQNDFSWFAEADIINCSVKEALPQIVAADFRVEELSPKVAEVIKKYIQTTKLSSISEIQSLAARLKNNDEAAWQALWDLVWSRLTERQWPLPTVADFNCVQAENELLAWVLAYGSVVNHFTVRVDCLEKFSCLKEFNHYISEELQLNLNRQAAEIKGDRAAGLEQSSTQAPLLVKQLKDGEVMITEPFLEFIWRFPNKENPYYWQDYFTGFVPRFANHVVESLYDVEK